MGETFERTLAAGWPAPPRVRGAGAPRLQPQRPAPRGEPLVRARQRARSLQFMLFLLSPGRRGRWALIPAQPPGWPRRPAMAAGTAFPPGPARALPLGLHGGGGPPAAASALRLAADGTEGSVSQETAVPGEGRAVLAAVTGGRCGQGRGLGTRSRLRGESDAGPTPPFLAKERTDRAPFGVGR